MSHASCPRGAKSIGLCSTVGWSGSVHSAVIPMIRHFMILDRQEIAASSFQELQSRFSTNTSGPLSPIRM